MDVDEWNLHDRRNGVPTQVTGHEVCWIVRSAEKGRKKLD